MNLKNCLVVWIMPAFFFLSCNNLAENTGAPDTPIQTAGPESKEEINLVNGEKWKINEEMRPFIANGEKRVIAFQENGDTGYDGLAEQLENENKQLIKSCTMEGESHEELHKWLHPHLELVKRLKNVEDRRTAEHLVSDLKASYQNFHDYFE